MTGSGSGCGKDWPRCQGEFLPLEHGPAAWMEYSHRALSGAALLLGIWLLLVAVRNRSALPFVLRFAVASFLFLLIEALIGAGTVLTGLTGENVSVARGILVAFHLVNSLLLIGSLSLTVLLAHPGQSRPQFQRVHSGLSLSMLLGLVGMLVLMFSGGIAAMGNTMFPTDSLQAGIAEDFSREANLLIRLRIWHPPLAIGVGAYIWLVFGVSGWVQAGKDFSRISGAASTGAGFSWHTAHRSWLGLPTWGSWDPLCFKSCIWVWPLLHSPFGLQLLG